MKKRLVMLLLGIACLSPVAFASDDEMFVVLDVEIRADGELVSTPRVAFTPGEDASIRQGLDDGLVLALAFHSTHAVEKGPKILVDVDFGIDKAGHHESYYAMMPWREPFEFAFSAALDAPSIGVRVTPSQASRSDFLLRGK